ncbi:MAG: ATP-dependent Clp protease ATP-binding subunit [Elusimicrobia bacterium]|nr:ATP-dependent Clp protease ATP-binding subunit [Elusimicrobiota bacterium]
MWNSRDFHPLILLLVLMGVVIGMFALHDRLPILIPIIFIGSLLGLAVRYAQILQERRRRRDSTVVLDYDELRLRELLPAAPAIKQLLRGHDAIVDRVAERLQQNLGLATPGRTLGAFLLVGPTGTGKTYLAELCAKALYPESDPIILRMNQYKSSQDVYTLLGPPPGQPGYEVGGALTRPVILNPYRVVILDEFEKCHPDVKHCFDDVLGRGLCSEKSSGKTAHFGGCAFIAT